MFQLFSLLLRPPVLRPTPLPSFARAPIVPAAKPMTAPMAATTSKLVVADHNPALVAPPSPCALTWRPRRVHGSAHLPITAAVHLPGRYASALELFDATCLSLLIDRSTTPGPRCAPLLGYAAGCHEAWASISQTRFRPVEGVPRVLLSVVHGRRKRLRKYVGDIHLTTCATFRYARVTRVSQPGLARGLGGGALAAAEPCGPCYVVPLWANRVSAAFRRESAMRAGRDVRVRVP
ncbi:hypothetical protein B0H10DRAFT_2223170 [Mycena sp. CBHHK59/15]|nr:hypothetical protein B0H10DRAFT_2223170 [Mycena sp. CBHHK59/15]